MRGARSQLHYLDDEVRNVAFQVIWKATLWSDYVPLSRRKESCEDGGPWAIPDVLDERWVSSVILEHCTGDRVEGHLVVKWLQDVAGGYCEQLYRKRTEHIADVPIVLITLG